MEETNCNLLTAGLRSFGIEPDDGMVDRIGRHLAMVAEWNERINLTAITQEREMVVKHGIDSASALRVVKLQPGMKVADVGTGAGFPGVTLKCIEPGIQLSLMESLQKRCKFLEQVGAEVFGGSPVGYNVVWGRAEDLGQDGKHREQYDVVFARAVAELRVLSEYCLPLCRVGGSFVAMKGPAADEELSAAERAINMLGGQIEEVQEVTLPLEAGARTLIRVKKTKPTPKGYPRKAGTPSKSPL